MEIRLASAEHLPTETAAPIERDRVAVPIKVPELAVAVEPAKQVSEPISVVPSTDSAGDDSTNVWPDEAAEAAFLAESKEASGFKTPVPVSAVAPLEDEEAIKPLPALDELVQRIPPETRDLLDELFRAKFTTVRRVRKTDLKA